MKKALALLSILSGVLSINTNAVAVEAAPSAPTPAPKNPVIPAGCKVFTFPDGFTCVAINEKNANKKWTKHLERNAIPA